MTELLSCPFCGGRAAAGRTYNGETTLFKVQCMSCPAAMKGYDQSVADAIDAWNTRAAPARWDAETAVAAERERCAKIAVEFGAFPGERFIKEIRLMCGNAIADKIRETQVVSSAQYRCTCGAEPYCAPNVHDASCPLAVTSTHHQTARE